MPSLNILNLNAGDSQEDIIRKVNSNFDSIVSNGGGPKGPKGQNGPQGPVGPAGPKGDPGQQGTRGTKWFVQATGPTGGVNDPILVGDYWVDVFNENTIYQYGSEGWVSTNSNLQAEEVFKSLEGISGPAGNKNAIVFSSVFPQINTLVLSDALANVSTVNPTYAKVLISTNSVSDYPILEFSKTNASNVGSPIDYNRHPQFRWLNPASTNYNLLFTVPQDTLTIRSGGNLLIRSASSTLTFYSNSTLGFSAGGNMSFTSNSSITINAKNGTAAFSLTSSKAVLSNTKFQLSVPLTINNNSSNFALNIYNNYTPVSGVGGGGLRVNTASNSSSYYIADFQSSGSRIFGARADGRTEVVQMVNGFTSFVGTAANSWSDSGGGTGTDNVWRIGYDILNNGNVLLVDLTPGTLSNRVLMFPYGSALTNYGSWTSYLDNYSSICIKISSVDETKKITALSIGSSVGSPGTIEAFGTAALSVDVILVKGSGINDFSIYYATCEGDCGRISSL